MPRIFTFACIIAALLLTSCQKEYVLAGIDNPTGGNGTGDLLVKFVTESPLAKLTFNYTYNTAKNLSSRSFDVVGTLSSTTISVISSLQRDANERVTKIINTSVLTDSAETTRDTSITVVHYPDAATKKFDYYVNTQTSSGSFSQDSILATYNTSGQVTELVGYVISELGSYVEKNLLTYDARGNVTTVQTFTSEDGTTYTPASTTTYAYDDKKAYLNIGLESFLFSEFDLICPNNVTNGQTKDLTGAGSDISQAISYTYGTNNKPSTGVATQHQLSGDYSLKLSYFYQ